MLRKEIKEPLLWREYRIVPLRLSEKDCRKVLIVWELAIRISKVELHTQDFHKRWDLPPGLAAYLNKYLVNKVPEKDLKGAYFLVHLHPESQKFVSFQWKCQLFQLLCLCFCLDRAPKIFKKLLKILVTLLMKQMVRLIIFYDNILNMKPQ